MVDSKRPARPRGLGKGKVKEPLGAGARWVRDMLDRPGPSNWADILPLQQGTELRTADTPDELLERGIAEYTFLRASEGGILGKGKFSTVYKVVAPDGRHVGAATFGEGAKANRAGRLQAYAAVPTSPLDSRPLAAGADPARSIAPTSLLDRHRRMAIRSMLLELIRGEQCPEDHVPLPDFPLPLQPTMARYIMDQLVSVIRDCLHTGGRVCHRDLKPENILIHPKSGDLLLLDLGLGTRYSASEKKLTTCCGSPAFHSPEIVHALSLPAGEVTYMGPELDIWCLALTMLSLLLQVRFPLGTHHTSLSEMGRNVQECLQQLDSTYPAAALKPEEQQDWAVVRRGVEAFLRIDGEDRMDGFAAYHLGDRINDRVATFGDLNRHQNAVRSTSFMPTEVKYTIPVYLDPATEEAAAMSLALLNPEGHPQRKVESYIRYLLRCAGILYHQLPPDTLRPDSVADGHFDEAIYQLVLTWSPAVDLPVLLPPDLDGATSPKTWLANIFPFRSGMERSSSLPPRQRASTPPSKSLDSATTSNPGGKESLQCYMRISFESDPSRSPPDLSGPSSPAISLRHLTKTDNRSRASSVLGEGIEAGLDALTVGDPIAPLRPRSHSRPVQKTGPDFNALSPLAQSRDISPAPAQDSAWIAAGQGKPPTRRMASGRSASLVASPRKKGPSRVILHLSDARASLAIHKALAQSPAPTSPNEVHNEDSDIQASAPIPMTRGSLTADIKNGADEEPEERGRPRSKEDKNAVGLFAPPIPDGGAAGSTTARAAQEEGTLSFLGLFGTGHSPTARSVSVPAPLRREMLAM